MARSHTTTGLLIAVLSTVSFGTSGTLIKPLLEAGWSPTAAVTARALTAAVILLPVAIHSRRGRWDAVWRARWRLLLMGVVGVASTQLTYFAAIQTIPVSTALLIELLAPLLLVAIVWVRTRRVPRRLVLIGSALALGGLVLVIGPGAIQAVDPTGLAFAFLALLASGGYFLIAARPSDGLPPVALAAGGLTIGGILLGTLGLSGLLPFTATFGTVALLGGEIAWWAPLLFVAIVGTAFAYAVGITSAEMLGSRLASFVGLLEVIFASLFAWMLLGQQLSPLQLVGGLLILGGIAAVRAEREPADIEELQKSSTNMPNMQPL